MIDVENERSLLLQEMKVTKGSRFNAAERLRRRDRRRTSITAFATVYVILLTVVPLAVHLPDLYVNFVNVVVIIFSIVILISSLLQYSSGDPVRAELHHRCGLELNSLRREFRTAEPVTSDVIREFSKRYDGILRMYNVNHEPVDFERYKFEHPDEYPAPISVAENQSVQADLRKDSSFGRNVLASITAGFVFTLMIPVLILMVRDVGPRFSAILEFILHR